MRKSKNGNSVTISLMLKIRKKKKNFYTRPALLKLFLNLGLNQRKTEEPRRRRRGR